MYVFFKELIDKLFAAIALLLLSPIIFIASCLVFINLGHPVLFRQRRAGYKARSFYLYKFRTMTNEIDSSGVLLDDSLRLKRFGRWLRSSSIDELPGLFNVVKGDISFIGPRPLLISYLDLYSKEQSRRHDVKPGLSGWAQINGRNALSWEEKFRLDVWYVDHQSFWLDLRIFLITIWKVICREGINAPGNATVQYFKGSLSDD